MKILYVSYFFPPHRAIGSNRAWHLATELGRRGHEVTVLAVEPGQGDRDEGRFPQWRQPPGGLRVHRVAGMESGVEAAKQALRRRLAPPASSTTPGTTAAPSPWFARLRQLSGVIEPQLAWVPEATAVAARLMARHRFDVVLVSGRPFVTFLVGVALRRLFGVRLVFDMRDPWSQLHADEPSTARALVGFERWLLAHCDALLMNTEGAARTYRALHPEAAPRTHALRNAAPEIALRPAPTGHEGFTLTYGGVLYNRDLRPLLEAFARFCQAHPEARLKLIGRIEADNLDPALIERLGDRVEILGFMPFVQFKAHLEAASAMLIPIGGYDLCIPGKFYECLAEAKPMLFLGRTGHELTDLIERDLQIGAAAEPHDVEGILAALERLRGEVIPRLQRQGLDPERAAAFTLARRADQLEAILTSLPAYPRPEVP